MLRFGTKNILDVHGTSFQRHDVKVVITRSTFKNRVTRSSISTRLRLLSRVVRVHVRGENKRR